MATEENTPLTGGHLVSLRSEYRRDLRTFGFFFGFRDRLESEVCGSSIFLRCTLLGLSGCA